ncbi:MAG: hypothetical protein AAB699_01930 [Patescibacteria group bacterium]
MTQRAYLLTTAFVFLLVGVFHALRLILGWEATIGGVRIPLIVSAFAALGAFLLLWSALRLRV